MQSLQDLKLHCSIGLIIVAYIIKGEDKKWLKEKRRKRRRKRKRRKMV
jgi:hypothetical protein